MALAPPQPGWCDVIREYAASERTARRLTEQLRACEAAALAFCRLLERWNRGEAIPATPGAREAALRHAADRVETAARRARASALALPARARAGARRGPLVVRRAGSRGARRVAPDSRSRGRARVPESRRRRLSRARRARPGPRGPRRRCPPRQRPRPLVALGGALRPARHACSARRSTTCGPSPRSPPPAAERIRTRLMRPCTLRSRPPRTHQGTSLRPLVEPLLGADARLHPVHIGPLPSRHATPDHSRRLRQPRPRRALRGPAQARRDGRRRDPRALPGRQGREPGCRLRAAGRRGARSSGRSAATHSPPRRSLACGRQGSSSTCRNPIAPTGVALITVDAEGETTIVVSPGANAASAASSCPRPTRSSASRRSRTGRCIAAWEQATGLFCLNAAPARRSPSTPTSRSSTASSSSRSRAPTASSHSPSAPKARSSSKTGRRWPVRHRLQSTSSTAPPRAMPSRHACWSRCSKDETARKP